MRCPVDGENLVMTERFGVEIDYCPKCRGVWLDRGELDKIIERAAQADPVAGTPAPVALREPGRSAAQAYGQTYAQEPRREEARRDAPRRHDDDDDDYRRPRKRRESFLSELFDF